MLVALEMGIMQFTVIGETRNVLVGDGIAEVTPAYVMLLVDSAERPEDIDKNRAEAARIRAEERLQHKQSMHEYYQSKIALDRAMQRLQTAAKFMRYLRPFRFSLPRYIKQRTPPARFRSLCLRTDRGRLFHAPSDSLPNTL